MQPLRYRYAALRYRYTAPYIINTTTVAGFSQRLAAPACRHTETSLAPSSGKHTNSVAPPSLPPSTLHFRVVPRVVVVLPAPPRSFPVRLLSIFFPPPLFSARARVWLPLSQCVCVCVCLSVFLLSGSFCWRPLNPKSITQHQPTPKSPSTRKNNPNNN